MKDLGAVNIILGIKTVRDRKNGKLIIEKTKDVKYLLSRSYLIEALNFKMEFSRREIEKLKFIVMEF